MTTRSRAVELEYRKSKKHLGKNDACRFCSILPGSDEHIFEGDHFRLITNLFKYSVWDEQPVLDQIMLIPKKHVDSIKKLPVEAAVEFLELLGDYESRGYSIWARNSRSPTKTITHQHTHLIKTSGKRKRGMIFVRKPMIMLTW